MILNLLLLEGFKNIKMYFTQKVIFLSFFFFHFFFFLSNVKKNNWKKVLANPILLNKHSIQNL